MLLVVSNGGDGWLTATAGVSTGSARGCDGRADIWCDDKAVVTSM